MWFKAIYVAAILAREKLDTIRRASPRIPPVGAVVGLSVGPRAPFARARILAVEPIELDGLSEERRAQVLGCYAAEAGPFVRVRFELA
jgi:hypothetical protein